MIKLVSQKILIFEHNLMDFDFSNLHWSSPLRLIFATKFQLLITPVLRSDNLRQFKVVPRTIDPIHQLILKMLSFLFKSTIQSQIS